MAHWFWIAAAAVLLAPVVAAQQPGEGCMRQCSPQDPDVNDPPFRTEGPVNVVLYAHSMGQLFRAPLTVVPPGPDEGDEGMSFLLPTLVLDTGIPATSVNFKYNELTFNSCPGSIHRRDEGVWISNCHSYLFGSDLHLAGDPVFYLYLSFGDEAPGDGATGSDGTPSVVPLMGLRGRMTLGAHGIKEEPAVIASGDTGLGPGLRVGNVGGAQVYEFALPLQVQLPMIPSGWTGRQEPGFMVEIEPYQLQTESFEYMQRDWRLRSGPQFPNRLILPLENPLEPRGGEFSLVNESFYYRATFGTPLGSYDLDPETLALAIEGPVTLAPDVARLVLVKQSMDHDGVGKPVNASWQVDAAALREHPGLYTFRASATNLQGTFGVENVFVYEVPDLNAVGVPALSVLLALAAAAVAAGWRGRPKA